MPPIANTPIWFESTLEVAARYLRTLSDAEREAIGRPVEALSKAEQRAAKVLIASKLEPARPITTLREWDTRWDASAAWRRIKERIMDLGGVVLIHKGGGDAVDVSRDVLAAQEQDTVVLDREALRAKARAASANGLLIPLADDDMLVIGLAAELHDLVSRRMGGPPLEWVAALSEPLFVQRLLGLPFNPMVLQFVPEAPPTPVPETAQFEE